MDTVYIQNLQTDAIIGVFDWERVNRQPININIRMAWDNRPAASADDLSLALDYKAVSDRVVAYINDSEFFLVETLAETLAELIMREFSVPWLSLSIGKPTAIEHADEVGVLIERGKRPSDQQA